MKKNKKILLLIISVLGVLFSDCSKAEELLYLQNNSDTSFGYGTVIGEGSGQTFVSEDDWDTITKYGFYISARSGTWNANCLLVIGNQTSSFYVGSTTMSIVSTGWNYCVFPSPVNININQLYEIRIRYLSGGGSITSLSAQNDNQYNNGFYTDYYSANYNDFQVYKDYDAKFSLYGEKLSTTTATTTINIDGCVSSSSIDQIIRYHTADGNDTYFIPFLDYFFVSNLIFSIIIFLILFDWNKKRKSGKI